MGCLVCVILEGMVRKPVAVDEREEFLDQLAYDIAYGYPDLVKKINEYVAKLYPEGGGEE